MISYYINYLDDDELVTETFEDFTGFLPFWNSQLCKINTSSVVIHCGIQNIVTEIPSDSHISDIVSKPVFFTESAKWCVPRLYSSTFANPICELVCGIQKEKVRLYLSLYEWDYCISEKELEMLYKKFPELTTTDREICIYSETYGWIQSFFECSSTSKSEREVLLNLQILSPESYYKNYTKIPDGLKFKCEKFRYHHHKNQIPDYDLNALIKYMPYFLDDNGILALGLSVRATNGLMSHGCSKFGDLRNCDPVKLSKQRNLGKKSMKEIWDRISAYVEQYCSEGSTDLIVNPDIKIKDTLHENILHSLNKHILEANKDVSRIQKRILKENRNKIEMDIVTSRLGLNKNGYVPTLEELGKRHALTRERIRQIFNKCLQSIILCEDWDDLMINKLNYIIKENEKSSHPEPIFLDMLETKDEWFKGFGENMLALKNCIVEFSAQPKSTDISGYRKTSKLNKEVNFTVIEPEQIARYIIFKPTPLIKNSSDFNDFIKSLIGKIEPVIETSRYDPNFHSILEGESQRIVKEECALHGLEILSITILEIVIKYLSENSSKQEKVNQYIYNLFQNNNNLLSLDRLIKHITQKGIMSSSRGIEGLIKTSIRSFTGSIYYLGQGAYGNRKCYENKYKHLGKSEINYYLNLIDKITSERKFNKFSCGKLLQEIQKRTPPSYFKDYWIDVYFLKFNLSNDAKYKNEEGQGKTFNFKRVKIS